MFAFACKMASTQETSIKKKLGDLRVVDLKAELEKRSLGVTGVKAVLVERLSKVIYLIVLNLSKFVHGLLVRPLKRVT